MFNTPIGIKTPVSLQDVFRDRHHQLDTPPFEPFSFRFYPGEKFRLIDDFIDNMGDSRFALIAAIIVRACGVQESDLGIDISVHRDTYTYNSWHEDTGLDNRPFHMGRAVVADILPTEVEGRRNSTEPFEVVAFTGEETHRAPENPYQLVRTKITVTHAPTYPHWKDVS